MGIRKFCVPMLLCCCWPGWLAAERVVTASVLNVRSQPSTSGEVLAKLRRGDPVEVIGTEKDWYEIKPPRGVTRRCFVSKSLIAEVRPEPKSPARGKAAAGPSAREILTSAGAKKLKDSVTFRGRFFALPKEQAATGIPYAVLKIVGDRYVIDCFALGDPEDKLPSFVDREVRVVGEYYQIPNWKTRVVYIKSIKENEPQ